MDKKEFNNLLTKSTFLLAAFCAALASRVVDKCQPIPLAHGEYSTVTGKLLRDAYQPLHSILAVLDVAKYGDDTPDKGI